MPSTGASRQVCTIESVQARSQPKLGKPNHHDLQLQVPEASKAHGSSAINRQRDARHIACRR